MNSKKNNSCRGNYMRKYGICFNIQFFMDKMKKVKKKRKMAKKITLPH